MRQGCPGNEHPTEFPNAAGLIAHFRGFWKRRRAEAFLLARRENIFWLPPVTRTYQELPALTERQPKVGWLVVMREVRSEIKKKITIGIKIKIGGPTFGG
jgi:hypothetical protein